MHSAVLVCPGMRSLGVLVAGEGGPGLSGLNLSSS